MKFSVMFLVLQIITWFYLSSNYLLFYGIMTIGCCVQLVEVLNYLANLPDKTAFGPISKQNVSPSVFMSIVKKIDIKKKYKINRFVFQTEDGYDLTVFRIGITKIDWDFENQNTIKNPIIFVHGIISSSCCWVDNKNGILYHILDKGYDCWLVNLRGNKFNLSHRNKDISEEEFFDFNLHDYITKDIPTILENV